MFKKIVFITTKKVSTKFYSVQYKEKFSEIKMDMLSAENNGICVISLNRPTIKNAVNRKMIEELTEAFQSLYYNTNVRVIILRSLIPNIFCSGADLKERQKLSQAETQQMVSKFRSLTNLIESAPAPILAAIDGIAIGGGLEIALACDIRVASMDARFGVVETKLAVIPGAGGTQRLPRLVGPSIAKELIFTGRIINAEEALKYGILNHVVEQDGTKTAAFSKALKISHEILPNGPVSIRMAKAAINRGLQVDINTGCAIEESCYAQVIPTKDRIEGITAFLNKRPPNYTGN